MVPVGNLLGDNRHDWSDTAVLLGDDWVAEYPDPRAGACVNLAAGGYPDGLYAGNIRPSHLAVQEDGDVKRHFRMQILDSLNAGRPE